MNRNNNAARQKRQREAEADRAWSKSRGGFVQDRYGRDRDLIPRPKPIEPPVLNTTA
jgi:hypothetical protein